MNYVHIHLLLNHFPTIGFFIGLAVFFIALVRRSDELQEAGLVIFFVTAALTIATYVTGNDAQEAIRDTPGVSQALVSQHESAALVAFGFMQATGFFAWVGLWMLRRIGRVAGWNLSVITLLAILTFVLMSRAAYIGGELRHPEIQDAQVSSLDPDAPTLARSWGHFVEANTWVWPTCETLHFVGLSMLFGIVLTLDLRMLGVGKNTLSFEALYQLLPLGMLGFTLNLITGMMFFVAMPKQYTGYLFFLKMALVVFGALNVLYFMLCKAPWSVEDGVDAPKLTKLVAASAIIIWIAVLFCGHMLPWLGNSF
jgi:uncharacterized membrane protein